MSSMEMMAKQIPYQYRMQFTCVFLLYFKPAVRFGSLMYPFFIVGCLLICLYAYIFYLVHKLKPNINTATSEIEEQREQQPGKEKMHKYMIRQRKIMKTMVLILLTYYLIYSPGVILNFIYNDHVPETKVEVKLHYHTIIWICLSVCLSVS